jgi:hypothetical protein
MAAPVEADITRQGYRFVPLRQPRSLSCPMMRRLLRWTIRFALLVAVISFARAILEARRPPAPPSGVPWPPIEPAVVPATRLTAPVADTTLAPSVDPVDGTCPITHPVKGKQKSGLFHEPGMAQYERTHPDRCYVDANAAEADGLTRAKH